MAQQPSVLKNVAIKGTGGLVIGFILVGAAYALGFPFIFQAMFFFYAMLGAAVFILLDAPSLKPISGMKAVAALVAFYIILSSVYIVGASLWPQYDPNDEKEKIDKLLSRRKAMTEEGKTEELIARAKALSEKAEALMSRLESAGVKGVDAVAVSMPKSKPKASGGDLVAMGLEQWNLQECYNCHVISIGEKSEKKKRGPNLDNVGTVLTAEQIKKKILYPRSLMAEGYEKQFKQKKGRMPDKYRDLMFDEEVEALVAFLTTLKDTSADTPKVIPVKD